MRFSVGFSVGFSVAFSVAFSVGFSLGFSVRFSVRFFVGFSVKFPMAFSVAISVPYRSKSAKTKNKDIYLYISRIKNILIFKTIFSFFLNYFRTKYIFILTIFFRLISMVYVLCQISCYFRDAISSKVQVQVQVQVHEEQVKTLPLNKTF